MRIAILANAFDETKGGAGRIAQVYADGLKDRGHEIVFWGPKPWFEKLSQASLIKRLYWHVSDIGVWSEMTKQICAWKPDVLLTHNLTGCGFGTASKIQQTGIRWVHVLHDVQLIEPSGKIMHGESVSALRNLWRLTWSRLRQKSFGHPDKVVSPTNWLIDFHHSWKWFVADPARVIPNPIDIKTSTHAKIPGRMMFVGRFELDKGFDVLLDAWNKVWRPGMELICIGDGSLRPSQDMQQQKQITCVGWKTSDQVVAYMAEAEAVIVPSRLIENQPTVILEALSQRCHVIASNSGGIPETLAGCGQIVDLNQSDGFVRALFAFRDRVGLDERVSAESVLARHALRTSLAQLEEILREK